MNVSVSKAMAVIFSRDGADCGARSPSRRSVQTMTAKIRSASARWVASRYCETSTRCESPDVTIHQPTAPCSAPRPKISHSPPPQLTAEKSAPKEVKEREQIGHADHAPEQPVAPFPPEDCLELIETHAG